MGERARGRNEFRTVRYQQQHAEFAEPIGEQTKQFLRCGVNPLRVLEENAEGLIEPGQQDVPQQRELSP